MPGGCTIQPCFDVPSVTREADIQYDCGLISIFLSTESLDLFENKFLVLIWWFIQVDSGGGVPWLG